MSSNNGKNPNNVTANSTHTNDDADINSPFLYNFITAGMSSAFSVTVMAPVERAKIILQVQRSSTDHIMEQGKAPYKNFLDVIKRLVKEQGFLSLWRGNTAAVIRCFPYQALNFALKHKYQNILENVIPGQNSYGKVLSSVLAGGIGGGTALCIVYPLDFARTRMAVTMEREINVKGNEFPEKKVTLKRTLQRAYNTQGFRGLYRGFWFSIMGVFTYRSFYFGLYDTEKFLTPVEYRSFLSAFLQAELAASLSGFISYPFDTVRRSIMVQQKQDKLTQPKNARYYIAKIYKSQGITGFYHGAGINIIRGTGGAIMLVLNDHWHDLYVRLHRSYSESSKSTSLPELPEPGSKPVPSLIPSFGVSPEVKDLLEYRLRKTAKREDEKRAKEDAENENENETPTSTSTSTEAQNKKEKSRSLDRRASGTCDF